MMFPYQHIVVDEINDVTVVTLLERRLFSDRKIQEAGAELLALVQEEKRKLIILDFTNAAFVSSTFIGKMISLHDKIDEIKGGMLVMCRFNYDTLEKLHITCLNKKFHIEHTRGDALAAFHA